MLVKVYNDNNKEYRETMDDKTYVIPARGFIELPRSEARSLFTRPSQIKRDGMGQDLTPKMLRLEFPKDAAGNEMRYRNRGDQNKSMLNGVIYPTANALAAHILANASLLDNVDEGLKGLKKNGSKS